MDFKGHDVFSYCQKVKEEYLMSEIRGIHLHHLENCFEYSKLFRSKGFEFYELKDIPYLPVSAFKNFSLMSVNKTDVVKILTSSGTTGSMVSKIYLDKRTANLQTLALTKIFLKLLGNERLPMLIFDSRTILSDRTQFSARGAGILGLFPFGKNHTFCLKEDLTVDYEVLNAFLEKHKDQKFLIFGFTFLIWSCMVKSSLKIDLSNSILIHSGGWKKLSNLGITNNNFRKILLERFGISEIYNYYGMVEQVGTIFVESIDDTFICPIFSDVIIRNPETFDVARDGEVGLVQILSILPWSYPGHSILTEDLGYIVPRNSESEIKRFKILGRAPKAEMRGCSDTLNTVNNGL